MTTYNIDWQSGGDESIPGKDDISLPPNTVDNTSTSVTLTGRGLSNWGEIQQENFIRLMENFASENEPVAPTIGQLWFNAAESILYMYIDSTNSIISGEPRYFPSGEGSWVQVYPAAEIAANLQEYNDLAERINKVIGAPSTSGSFADPADNQWGWGQTGLVPDLTVDSTSPFSTYTDTVNVLPIYSNRNTAAYPGGVDFPRAFDNTAWCDLIAVLYKAARAVYTPGLAGDIPQRGFIRDARGRVSGDTSDDITRSTTFAGPLYGIPPTNYLRAGWGNRGIVEKIVQWDDINTAVDQLEAGRFVFPTANMVAEELGSDTLTTWTIASNPTLTHTYTVTWASETAARAFFNAGGYLRFDLSSGDDNIYAGADQSWEDFLANEVDGLVFDYRGVGFKQADPSPFIDYDPGTSPADGHGFYDLLTFFNAADYALKKIFTNSRSAGSAYASTTGVEVEAKVDAISPTLQMTFVVRFLEDNNGEVVGSVLADQPALTSALWSVKKDEFNMNAPVLSHPTATDTGIV